MTEAALFELLSLECCVDCNGTIRYYNTQGQLHRVHGPAVDMPACYQAWFQNGQRHRIDAPAIEYSDGFRAWFQNGQRHRLDGPAIEYSDGSCGWYIDGTALTETEWQQAVASMGVV